MHSLGNYREMTIPTSPARGPRNDIIGVPGTPHGPSGQVTPHPDRPLPRPLAHRLLLPVLHRARVFPVWLLSLDRISGRTTRVAAFNESWFALIAVRGVHYRGVAARHHCRWAWEWRPVWGYDPRRCQEHFSTCVWGTHVRACVWHRPRVVGCPRVRC